MDLLIILTYTAICIAVFKAFKIPLNKWSVPTAVLGGVVILSALMLMMNYNHPYAKHGKEVFATVPIVPNVTGTVVEVNVKPNEAVKKGDLLFKIDPTPFQAKVDQFNALIADAQSGVLQNNQRLQSAIANVAQTKAQVEKADITYNRLLKANEEAGDNAAISQQVIDNNLKALEAAQSALSSAKAEEQRIRLLATSEIAGTNPQVAQLQAQLDKAMFDLESTQVRAPSDGIVTQIALRKGVRAASLPLRPVMTFVPEEKRRFAGVFWQNSLLKMKVGAEAEIILDSMPGRIFKGKLVSLLPAMSEGEIQAAGSLISANRLRSHGFAIGVIEFDEDISQFNLPRGVQGTAVIINADSDPLHVSMVRKILLRMMSWLNYVYPIK